MNEIIFAKQRDNPKSQKVDFEANFHQCLQKCTKCIYLSQQWLEGTMEVVQEKVHEGHIRLSNVSLVIEHNTGWHDNLLILEVLSMLKSVRLHPMHDPLHCNVAGAHKSTGQVSLPWSAKAEKKGSNVM